MQIASKEDIEAPIEDVFAMLSEFESFERSAIRRGIEVQRMSEDAAPRKGLSWAVRFSWRGKTRDMHLELAEYDRPTGMRFEGVSPTMNGTLVLDLLPLSQRRTRMAVVLNLKPRTLAARLMIQSARLAKANLTRRFKLKVAEYAKSMEDRHQRMA